MAEANGGFLNDEEMERYARLKIAGGVPLPGPEADAALAAYQSADLSQPIMTDAQLQEIIATYQQARQGVPLEPTTNPVVAGLKGVAASGYNMVPFLRSWSGASTPVEKAPNPNATETAFGRLSDAIGLGEKPGRVFGKGLQATGQFASNLIAGIGETVAGSLIGAPAGPVGVVIGSGATAAAGEAMQINEQKRIQAEREKQKILDDASWWMPKDVAKARADEQVEVAPWDFGDKAQAIGTGVISGGTLGIGGALAKSAGKNVAGDLVEGLSKKAIESLSRTEYGKMLLKQFAVDTIAGGGESLITAANQMDADIRTPEGRKQMAEYIGSRDFATDMALESLVNIISQGAMAKSDMRQIRDNISEAFGRKRPERGQIKQGRNQQEQIAEDEDEVLRRWMEELPDSDETPDAVGVDTEPVPPAAPGVAVEPAPVNVDGVRTKPRGETDEATSDGGQERTGDNESVAVMPEETRAGRAEPAAAEAEAERVPDVVARPKEAEQAEPEVEVDNAGNVKAVRGKKALYAHPGKTVESEPHEVRYALREIDDIQPSHFPETGFQRNPNYPAQIQNRLYDSNKSEQFKVQRNAANLSPSKLINENTGSDDAPSIVDRDGNVLSGNSRRMSIGLARDAYPEKYEAYLAYLRENAAKFGLRPEDVDRMKAPMLVREVDFPDDVDFTQRTAFGSAANQSASLRQTPAEIGATLATGERIPKEVKRSLMESIEADQLSKALSDSRFVESFKKAMYADNPNEAAAFFTPDGLQLNEQGKAVAKAMLYHDAIGDRDIANHIASGDASTRTAIEHALVQLSSLKRAPDQWQITKPLRNALKAIAENPKAETAQDVIDGTSSDLVNDIDAPAPPKLTKKEKAFIRLIKDGKPTYLREVLKGYREYAQAGDSMFGDNMSPSDALDSLTSQKFRDADARDSMRKSAVVDEGDMIGANMFGAGTVGDAAKKEPEAPAPKAKAKPAKKPEPVEVDSSELTDANFTFRKTDRGDVFTYAAKGENKRAVVITPDKSGTFGVVIVRRNKDGTAAQKRVGSKLSYDEAVERGKAHVAAEFGKTYTGTADSPAPAPAPARATTEVKPQAAPKPKPKSKAPDLTDSDFIVTEKSDEKGVPPRHVVRTTRIDDVKSRNLIVQDSGNGTWLVADYEGVIDVELTEDQAISRAKQILNERYQSEQAKKTETKATPAAKKKAPAKPTSTAKTPGFDVTKPGIRGKKAVSSVDVAGTAGSRTATVEADLVDAVKDGKPGKKLPMKTARVWRVVDKSGQIVEDGLTYQKAIAAAQKHLTAKASGGPKVEASAAKKKAPAKKAATKIDAMRMLLPGKGQPDFVGEVNTVGAGDSAKGYTQTEAHMPKAVTAEELGMVLQPLDGPALYDLAGQLIGRDNVKLMGAKEMSSLQKGTLGYLKKLRSKIAGREGLELGIRADLIKRGSAALFNRVLAHEIGHAVDWMPTMARDSKRAFTTARGNVVGHIYALHNYMRKTWGTDKITNQMYRKELIALTEKWNPYDKSKADADYVKYRNSSKELYADFISVLLNNPQLAMEMAPNTTRAFIRALGERPEVEAAYMGIQSDMAKSVQELAAKRVADIQKGFHEGDEALRKQIADKNQAKTKREPSRAENYVDMFSLLTTWGREVKKKHGGRIPDELNAREDVERMMRNQGVWEVVAAQERAQAHLAAVYGDSDNAKEAAWNDVGTFMFLDRITGDRKNYVNPGNYQPDSAAKTIDGLRQNLGEDKFKAVKDAAEELRELGEITLLDAYEVGLVSKEQYEAWTKDGEHRKYAPFRPVEYVKVDESPTYEHMKGTLKDVANPATEYLLKQLAFKRIIAEQRAKQTTVQLGTSLGVVSKLGDGESPRPEMGKLTLRENGKAVSYEIDPILADAFDGWNKGIDDRIAKRLWWRAIQLGNRWQKAAYLTFSVPFALRQVFRDVEQSYSNMPRQAQKGPLKDVKRVIASTFKSFPESWKYTKGEYSDDVQWLINKADIEYHGNGLYSGTSTEAKDTVLQRLGLLEKTEPTRFQKIMDTKYGKVAAALPNFVKRFSESTEVLPKIAMLKLLRDSGLTEKEISGVLRNYIGTPNYSAKGFMTPYTNTVAQFSNIAIQHYRAELDQWRDANAGRKAVVVGRRALTMPTISIITGILYGMAEAGFFGEENKEAYGKMSEYDKSNYTCIWFGGWRATKDGGRVPVYLRLPKYERSRVVQGMFYKGWRAAVAGESVPESVWGMFMNSASYMLGQLPSVTSNLQLAWNTAWIAGGGPGWDSFRNRPIVSEQERNAGMTFEEWAKYAGDQMGFRSLNPANAVSSFIKNIPVFSMAPRSAPLDASIVDEVDKRQVEQDKRSMNARRVRSKYFETGDESVLEDAVDAGEITQRQADRIKADAQLTPEERYLKGRGVPKKEWGDYIGK